MNERQKRRLEQNATVSSLLQQFQANLTELTEFRQAIAEKYVPEPTKATPHEVDTVIETFFSKDPKKSFLTDTYIPGVHFTKDGYEYNVNYSTQAGVLTMLRKNDNSFLIVGLKAGTDKGLAWYSEDPKSINVNEKLARIKAHELLNTIKKDKTIFPKCSTLDLPSSTI